MENKDTTTKKPTTPWKPSSILEANKRTGYRRRWVTTANLEKSISEGWQPVEGKKESPIVTLMDGKQLTMLVRKRNLILCEMPEELAKSRAKYYEDLNQESTKKPYRDLDKEATVRGYKGSGAHGTIVIEKGGI